MSARCVMVLGTHSGAGKSWLATALARWYRRQGLRVAPFKAQNMSNNARVVPTPGGEAGEIGSAQYFQALAAGVPPDTRMNPVLLKPVADTASQVVVNGHVDAALGALPWRARSALLWPHAEAALQSLRDNFDVLVIEGAGSPAEINLAQDDFVNTRTALAAQAACLLVGDIDRGGVFAHLYGTHALMDPRVAALLRGFVLNRFRGDAALLPPAPEQLRALTGVPTLAVIPMVRDHGLPEEDGLQSERVLETERGLETERVLKAPRGMEPPQESESQRRCAPMQTPLRISVIAWPHLSNLDEFQPLAQLPGIRLSWVRDATQAARADWLILPGSKNTRGDLGWLRSRPGLAATIAAHVQSDKPLLAICGGLQVLGQRLDDPLGADGDTPGSSDGLGLAPWFTTFGSRKTLRATRATFGTLSGAWQPLTGLTVNGYEIHTGHTTVPSPAAASPPAPAASSTRQGACQPAFQTAHVGWQHGNLLAVYLHGLLENREVQRRLFGARVPPLDDTFERLADQVDRAFAPGSLLALVEPATASRSAG